MDKDIAVIASSIVIGFSLLIGMLCWTGTVSSRNYYDTVNKCTEAGGTWIGAAHMCFRR
jgi:hypothetical protein